MPAQRDRRLSSTTTGAPARQCGKIPAPDRVQSLDQPLQIVRRAGDQHLDALPKRFSRPAITVGDRVVHVEVKMICAIDGVRSLPARQTADRCGRCALLPFLPASGDTRDLLRPSKVQQSRGRPWRPWRCHFFQAVPAMSKCAQSKNLAKRCKTWQRSPSRRRARPRWRRRRNASGLRRSRRRASSAVTGPAPSPCRTSRTAKSIAGGERPLRAPHPGR